MGYRGQVMGFLVFALAGAGCASASDPATNGRGGTSGAGGAVSAGTAGSLSNSGGSGGANSDPGGASGITSAGASGALTEQCPELGVARQPVGTVLELPIQPTLQGKPLRFGESNQLSDGSSLTPLDIRFYVSDVALLRASADPLPVDLVTASGTVEPYGVHLYSADAAESNTLRVLAPPGAYIGIQFLIGLPLPCNQRSPDASKAPLSPTSQMTWPHTGFLFLRYQGRTTPASTAANGGAGGAEPTGSMSGFPPVIHMGGSLTQELAPRVRVNGAFSVPASGSFSTGMHFVLDDVFKGALTDVDLTGFDGPPAPGEEVVLGERLRRNISGLQLFSLDP